MNRKIFEKEKKANSYIFQFFRMTDKDPFEMEDEEYEAELDEESAPSSESDGMWVFFVNFLDL